MLKQRVITALVIVALLIAALVYLSPAGVALVLAMAVAVSAWEWSRLAGFGSMLTQLVYAAVVAAVMYALWEYCNLGGQVRVEQVQAVMGVACLWWAFGLLWVMGYPASAGLWGHLPMLCLMGGLVLVPAWLAVAFLLGFENGGLLLLAMVLIVAAADIGAYFSGKRWGKHKLAPAVSPGKSWEGFFGGLAVCFLLALMFWWQLPMEKLGFAGILAIVLCTALASVLGDLLVSMAKRHRGVKDSSQLLPGHGGFLDRLDGYTAAAPVYALGLILAGW